MAKLDRSMSIRTRLRKGVANERKAMIDRNHDLPIGRQAKALGVSRGSVHDKPRPVSPQDLALMRRIDGPYLDVYNRLRPHSSLDRRAPDEACFQPVSFAAAA